MKTIEINLYKFDELSTESKRNATNNLATINIDHEWWECIYEDAANIGLKITSFDEYNVEAYFVDDAATTAKKIMADHGESCETYQDAASFLKDKDKDEFLSFLQEDYRIILNKEYDYLTSEDAIIETIEANEYDFTEKGELY